MLFNAYKFKYEHYCNFNIIANFSKNRNITKIHKIDASALKVFVPVTYLLNQAARLSRRFIAILNEAFHSATKFLTAPLYSVLNSLITYRRCYSFGFLARNDQLTSINIRHRPKTRITGFDHARWRQQFPATRCNAENNIK